MQYGTTAHSTVLICQQLVYKFVHVYFWIISVLSRSMVVTERQAEAMLNCHVELERIHVPNGRIIIGRSENVKARTVGGLSRSIVTEEEVEAMAKCRVHLHRIHVPTGRTIIYKCTSVYPRTVSGHLSKPKMKVNPNLMYMFNTSYKKNPSAAGKLVSCVDCSKKFKNERSMNSHWTAFHSGTFKYECSFCDKKFLNKHHFCTHERLHWKILNFSCPVCNKKFVRLAVLRHHLRAKHGRKYNCNHCGKGFGSAKILRQHLLEVDKFFVCSRCDRRYSHYASLFRHFQTCLG